ncbi:hypothetical protein D3C73_1168000 [compost metagenome]
MSQQREVEVQGLGLVLVQFFCEALVLTGRRAKDFGERSSSGNNDAGHLREQYEPGRFLGKKAQLHFASGLGTGGRRAA